MGLGMGCRYAGLRRSAWPRTAAGLSPRGASRARCRMHSSAKCTASVNVAIRNTQYKSIADRFAAHTVYAAVVRRARREENEIFLAGPFSGLFIDKNGTKAPKP
jgi:hypothetical protein